MAPIEGVRRLAGRATIRLRVALIAAFLGVTSLGALGYVDVSTSSKALTGVAEGQASTLTHQLASALVGNAPAMARLIPFTHDGLDGVALFDRSGHLSSQGGPLGPTLAQLSPEALAVARSGHSLSELRLPLTGGRSRPRGSLSPWSPGETIAVTISPRPGGGAAAAGFHTRWATDVLRQRLASSALSIAGSVLFICCGLMLLLGRLVTRPVACLAEEVRELGERDLELRLSEPRAPELGQLARDISRMRDELLDAVRRSSTDPLTGIANHRAFHERLEQEIANASPFALIALDLDNLKHVNDRFGHLAGDRVLEAVAGCIAAAARPGDLCARIGGDEFAIICPGLDAAAAEPIGEAARAAVKALGGELPIDSDFPVSLSLGIADMPQLAHTKDELLERADARLYAAKARSRAELPAALFERALDEREAGST